MIDALEAVLRRPRTVLTLMLVIATISTSIQQVTESKR